MHQVQGLTTEAPAGVPALASYLEKSNSSHCSMACTASPLHRRLDRGERWGPQVYRLLQLHTSCDGEEEAGASSHRGDGEW